MSPPETQFRLEIGQRYVEDLSETQTLSEPSWLAAVTTGGRAGDSELVFHYAESANYQGDGLSELLGIDVKPAVEADLEWRGTQADYIRIESSDYFNRQYDEYDMEETHVRDTYGRNSEGFLLELANLITTDGDLAGALTYSLVSDSEEEEEEDEVWEADASWTGDADETAEGRVKYHSTLDSTGHERMRSETGDWITLYDGQEDRKATFERIATAARAFDSETGEMTAGELTWTGDAHVQLFGTDLSETEWTPNELEEALNTIFTDDSTGYPEPPEDDGDGSDEDGSGGDGSGDGQSVGSEQSWWQWVLGGGGDWLDRNYSGGQYGDAGISGVILHTYSDLSTLLPGGGELRDGVDILVGVDAAGNRLTTTERVVTLGMLAIPVIPTRWVRGPLMSAVDWMGTLAKKAPDAAIPTLAPRRVTGQIDEAFHYTAREWGDVIKREGLRPGSYGTPNGNLSGLGAKLELSLPPTRTAPDIRIRIDLDGLRKAGYEIPTPTRVSNVVTGPDGRVYTMPGGGFEMQFPYEIPGEFLEVLPLR